LFAAAEQKSYLIKIQGRRNSVYGIMEAEKFSSCLYKARVVHHRLSPKKHHFFYDIFMFYLDLDELEDLHKTLMFLSRNRFNLFNFRDRDHVQLPRENPDRTKKIRTQIDRFLVENGISVKMEKIMLLTNVCTLGYQFNPVSIYYCFDAKGNPVCSVAEVCNTFGEMKLYLLGSESLSGDKFNLNTPKNFYVSPFIDLDAHFDFQLQIPNNQLDVRINDYTKDGNIFFMSSLRGTRSELSDRNLVLYFLSFPLITVKVILMIHWQALQLWRKKLAFLRKAENIAMQQEVYRPFKS
jgi:uncharacterized protein